MATPAHKSELFRTDIASLVSSIKSQSVPLPYQEIQRQQELQRISERWPLLAEMLTYPSEE